MFKIPSHTYTFKPLYTRFFVLFEINMNRLLDRDHIIDNDAPAFH